MNRDTDGTMCSIAGELGVRMRMRSFNRAETKNQHDADKGQPASKVALLELVMRKQFLRVKP